MTSYLHVAVGVIVDHAGQVLISKRSASSHQGGRWEFPGGKLEPGETVQQALARELYEELGITIHQDSCVPFTRILHAYPDRTVLLDVWSITGFDGQPVGREGQSIQWLHSDSLQPQDFPVANRKIISLLQLPRCIGITGAADNLSDFNSKLESLLAKNIQLVQLRQPSLDDEEFLLWTQHALNLCEKHRSRLLVNTRPELFLRTAAQGLHLNSARLLAQRSRPIGSEYLLSASCHNKEELGHAEKIGVDLVLLSPVLMTRSHAESNPLGWQRFREAIEAVDIPVYALGGMSPAHLPVVQQAGGFGIAAISAFWPDS